MVPARALATLTLATTPLGTMALATLGLAGCGGRAGRLDAEAFSRRAPDRILVERVENRTTRALGSVQFGGPGQRLLFGARSVDFLGLLRHEIRECLAEKGYELVPAPTDLSEGVPDREELFAESTADGNGLDGNDFDGNSAEAADRADGAAPFDAGFDRAVDGSDLDGPDLDGSRPTADTPSSPAPAVDAGTAVLRTRVDAFTARLARPLSFDLRYRIELLAGDELHTNSGSELLFGGSFRAKGAEDPRSPGQVSFVLDSVRRSVRSALSALPLAPRAR